MKKVFLSLGLLLTMTLATVVFNSCEKDDDGLNNSDSSPVILTLEATNITTNSATLGGNISNVDILTYTEKGVCCATHPNPTINNFKLVALDSETTGSFTVNARDLSENTTYYARTFATNSAGTVYGNQISFQTNRPLAAILGEYTASGTSYFDGIQEWTVTIEGEDSIVWITNFILGGSSKYRPIYGIVNTEETEIKIPVGQQMISSFSDNVKLVGYYGPNGDEEIPIDGSVTCVVGSDGKITVMDAIGSCLYNLTDGSLVGFYNYFLAGVVMVKK